MTKTIVALYDDFSTAERVIDNLIEAGFTRDDLSVMANDASGEYSSSLEDRDMVLDGDVSAGEGAGFGAVIGTLIGVGVSLIPGIGPVIGAGPLAIALTAGIGAAAGAITGGITAGLIDMGVDEDDAHIYAEGIRRGGTLVSLTTNDEWAERAETIMNRYHPVDIDTRSSLWREGGWSNFDSNAQPYNAEQIERERLTYRNYDVREGMGSIPEEDIYSDEQPRASTDTVPTTGGIPLAGNPETRQRASVETDRQRGMSTNPGGMGASSVSGTPSGRPEDRGTLPPGTERHHETSYAVDEALRRDTTGGDYATPEEEIEANRRARTYLRTGGKQDANPVDTNNLNR